MNNKNGLISPEEFQKIRQERQLRELQQQQQQSPVPISPQNQTPTIIQNNNNNNKRLNDNELTSPELPPNKKVSKGCLEFVDELSKMIDTQINEKIQTLQNNNNNNNLFKTYQFSYPPPPPPLQQTQHYLNKENYNINLQIRPSYDYRDGKEIPVLRIQEEFVKFIILKVMADDIDISKPSKLIPSPIIFNYWETMVLNIEKYIEFTKLIGANILYKLQDKLDMEDLKKQVEIKLKYIKTKELYEKFFPNNLIDNKYYNSIWNRNDDLPLPIIIKSTKTNQTSSNLSSNYINVFINSINQESICIQTKKNKQIKRLFDKYCELTGIDSDSSTFVFSGYRIIGSSTPDELDLKDGDKILCFPIKLTK